MICNRLGSQSGYEPKWFNRLIDALPMANNDDFGLICLFGSLDIDGLHFGSVCLVSKIFVATSFLGCIEWYGGKDSR